MSRSATRDEIIAAAQRCGLQDFKPTRMGDGWGAEVNDNTADASKLEDCIHEDLIEQGLVATRLR